MIDWPEGTSLVSVAPAPAPAPVPAPREPGLAEPEPEPAPPPMPEEADEDEAPEALEPTLTLSGSDVERSEEPEASDAGESGRIRPYGHGEFLYCTGYCDSCARGQAAGEGTETRVSTRGHDNTGSSRADPTSCAGMTVLRMMVRVAA